MNGFPLLLRKPERAGKELLLLGAKKLLRGQFVLAGIGTRKKSKVEHHDVLFVRIDAVEYCPQIVKRVVVANHDEDVPWSNAQSQRSQIVAWLQIELVEFRMDRCASFGHSLRDGEN